MITEADREEFRRLLEKRWRELVGEVEATEEALAGLGGSRPIEYSEEGQREALSQVLNSLDDREQREAQDVADALRRLAVGTYGRCESCSKPIARERLRALPEARLCLACERAAESS